MQYEVKIYGDISDNKGENLFTLQDLQEQLKGFSNQSGLLVGVKTKGGLVDEGFSIYNELRRFAKEKNIKITTRMDGIVASIGTVIFLAGDTRIVNDYFRPFFHPASGKADNEYLDYVNNQIAEFYSKHTKMSFDEAKILMQEETFVDTQTALNIGFGTEREDITPPSVLMKYSENNTKQNIKMNKEKGKSVLNQIWAILKGAEIKNKIVFDANNEEIDFFELEENETITPGTKATYKGSAAEGEVIMADGSIYVFTSGMLKEIKKKEDEELGAEKRASEEKIQQLQNQLAENKKNYEVVQAKLTQTQTALSEKTEVINKVLKMESHFQIEDKKEKPVVPVPESKTDGFMKNINKIKL